MKKHAEFDYRSGQNASVRLFTSRSTSIRLSEQAERRVASLMAAILAILALVGLVIWSTTGETTLNRIAAPASLVNPSQQQAEAAWPGRSIKVELSPLL